MPPQKRKGFIDFVLRTTHESQMTVVNVQERRLVSFHTHTSATSAPITLKTSSIICLSGGNPAVNDSRGHDEDVRATTNPNVGSCDFQKREPFIVHTHSLAYKYL